MSNDKNSGLTKRAPDWWDSAAFFDSFLASSFFCSQSESRPTHQRVTQTVGTPLAQQGKKTRCRKCMSMLSSE